jgi:1-deoxy-D-xylulose 5-phosphate reductoisomerase
MKQLSCSSAECKRKFYGVKNMSFEELEKYNTKCSNCGDWIFKEQEIANKTYNAVSNRWAEEFMYKRVKRG